MPRTKPKPAAERAPARRRLAAVAAIAVALIDRLRPSAARSAAGAPADARRRSASAPPPAQSSPQLAPQREADGRPAPAPAGDRRIDRRPERPLRRCSSTSPTEAAEPDPERPAVGQRPGREPGRRSRAAPSGSATTGSHGQVERRAEDQPQAPQRQHEHQQPGGKPERLLRRGRRCWRRHSRADW